MQISRGDEGDTSQVPEELPGAEIGRSRDFANCRSQNVGRLQKHEGSPPAVPVVRSGRVGDGSRSLDWRSVPRWSAARSIGGDTAEAQQQQCRDEVVQPMIE